jgi:hypothetical protein
MFSMNGGDTIDRGLGIISSLTTTPTPLNTYHIHKDIARTSTHHPPPAALVGDATDARKALTCNRQRPSTTVNNRQQPSVPIRVLFSRIFKHNTFPSTTVDNRQQPSVTVGMDVKALHASCVAASSVQGSC